MTPEDAIALGYPLGKPLVVDEFGLRRTLVGTGSREGAFFDDAEPPPSGYISAVQARRAVYDGWYRTALTSNVAGMMHWQFNPDGGNDSGDNYAWFWCNSGFEPDANVGYLPAAFDCGRDEARIYYVDEGLPTCGGETGYSRYADLTKCFGLQFRFALGAGAPTTSESCVADTCAGGRGADEDCSGAVDEGCFGTIGFDASWSAATRRSAEPLAIAYYQTFSADLELIRCSNASCFDWQPETTVESTGDVGQGPSVAILSGGEVAVAYSDATNNRVRFARCTSSGCSTPVTVGTGGPLTSIAVGSDGKPLVAYHDLSAPVSLKLAHCTTSTCGAADWTVADVKDSAMLSSNRALVVLPSGKPVLTYCSFGGDVVLVRCGDGVCTPAQAEFVTLGSGNGWASLALGVDGMPVIAYVTAGRIRIARCTGAGTGDGCTAQGLFTFKDLTGIGDYELPALVVPSNDHPVVTAYFEDTGAQDLLVAACADPTCQLPATVSRPDTEGNAGNYPSIAVDDSPLSLPLLLYRSDGGSLKGYRCANPQCTR